MSLARWQGHDGGQIWATKQYARLHSLFRQGTSMEKVQHILRRKSCLGELEPTGLQRDRRYVSGSRTITKETPGQLGLRGAVSLVASALDSEKQL
jgi:hypothetical protein